MALQNTQEILRQCTEFDQISLRVQDVASLLVIRGRMQELVGEARLCRQQAESALTQAERAADAKRTPETRLVAARARSAATQAIADSRTCETTLGHIRQQIARLEAVGDPSATKSKLVLLKSAAKVATESRVALDKALSAVAAVVAGRSLPDSQGSKVTISLTVVFRDGVLLGAVAGNVTGADKRHAQSELALRTSAQMRAMWMSKESFGLAHGAKTINVDCWVRFGHTNALHRS